MTWDDTDITQYDRSFNERLYYSFYAIATIGVSLIVLVSFVDVDFGVFSDFAGHVSSQVSSGSALGLFYLGGIGGYFIFTFPLEAGFIRGALSLPSWLAMAIMLAGIGVSYTLNYLTGRYLGHFIRPILGTKSYYKWKSRLGKWGAYVIIVTNLIPMISQSFTAVLGVFKYDWRRTALYTGIGQVVKFGVLLIIAQSI
jgi:membrane protein DedA with SNARE-associated domain